MPTPEERAREKIDQLLEAAGWQVQDRNQLNLGAARGVAVREFPLTTGFADYLLFADRKAVGVIEAKPEGTLHKFCEEHCHEWLDQDFLSGWWLGSRPPSWDLLSTCKVGDRNGVLLVEAKAHEGECQYEGKELEPWAPIRSKRNHQQIDLCLKEAEDGLNAACDGVFRLSTDSHYQLANRVAHMWKLASCGLPVVLLYLGFTGDTSFKRDCLVDADHWQRVMGAYMKGVVPLAFPRRAVQLENGGSIQMLIKSLPIGQGAED
jgi:hypothetical protein